MSEAQKNSRVEESASQGMVRATTVIIENLSQPPRIPTSLSPDPAAFKAILTCPYPGLAYFGPADAMHFFGRDRAVAGLERAIEHQTVTVLVGASASGKSSVVLAGLAPRLAASKWRCSYFQIGRETDNNPFSALARALVSLLADGDAIDQLVEVRELAAALQEDTLSLHDALRECELRNPGQRILLIADQFEELFTLVADDSVRARFIDTLITGFPPTAAGHLPTIRLVFTLRSDFYSMVLAHRGLADALQGHVENLGPMTLDELRQAIIRPAAIADVSFEDGLVERLIVDADARPGSLPLLQFVLREMWDRQEHGRITCASYYGIGGIGGALTRHAETVFEAVTNNGHNGDQVSSFQSLFTRLVAVTGRPGVGRRAVRRSELDIKVWALAQRLAEDRLVVIGAGPDGGDIVEIAHEALLHNWPRLVDWIDRERAFLIWRSNLVYSVSKWRADQKDDHNLLCGASLAAAEGWLEKRRSEFSLEERAYIAISAEKNAMDNFRWNTRYST
jgi:AAA ATPase domain